LLDLVRPDSRQGFAGSELPQRQSEVVREIAVAALELNCEAGLQVHYPFRTQ
jgi:hypothetical protein